MVFVYFIFNYFLIKQLKKNYCVPTFSANYFSACKCISALSFCGFLEVLYFNIISSALIITLYTHTQ